MRHFRQVISLENSHGAHCLFLMLERLGRRGRRKIIVKKHFEVVQLLPLQFFSPVSRCTRNRYFDLTKEQFIFFNFLKKWLGNSKRNGKHAGDEVIGPRGEAREAGASAENAGMRRRGRTGLSLRTSLVAGTSAQG